VAARYRQDPRLSQSEGMIEFVKQTVTDQSFPLAIFSPADMFAALAVDACLLMGIDVPTQVAVVGCDNDGLFNELARIPLSSMDTDISHYGWVAAETLDRMMRGKTVPKTVLIPPRGVITRRSSDILAVEDDALRKAVSFMSSHYADPIHVGDITHACGMSRRLLQTRFRALLHRTVQEDLTRMRVEYAAHLLRTTSHKTDFIGAASGLSNGERLARVFKRAVGQSPREYRQYYRHANLPGSNAPVDPLPDRAASQDARRGGQDARAPAERLAGRLRGAQRSGIP
jgi:LacI family transcriptional regulator